MSLRAGVGRAPDRQPAARLRLLHRALRLACRADRRGSASYLALELGEGVEGGVVERDTERALWLPYLEVADVTEATEQACGLRAAVLLKPGDGPAGWRSVVAAPAGAEVALWQPKAARGR
jgi:predicted enzyme related to lactoylglutathione lyase